MNCQRPAFGVLVFCAIASAIAAPLEAVADASKSPLATPTPKPFKIKCSGDAAYQVMISNIGAGPVPAGMVMRFEIPKGFVYSGGAFTQGGPIPGYDGSYVFAKPLDAGNQLIISVAPSPQPTAAGSPPWWLAIGALGILATVRPCTFTIAPAINAPAVHLEPGTIVPSPLYS